MNSKRYNPGRFLKNTLRRSLFSDQRGRCFYCNRLMRLRAKFRSPDFATIDHKTPTSKGGTENIDNLVLACLACNEAKGDMTADEFKGRGKG